MCHWEVWIWWWTSWTGPIVARTPSLSPDHAVARKARSPSASPSSTRPLGILRLPPPTTKTVTRPNSLMVSCTSSLKESSGWEEREDANGRTFYVNHELRTMQWHRPEADHDGERPALSHMLARLREDYEQRAEPVDEVATQIAGVSDLEEKEEETDRRWHEGALRGREDSR